MESNIGLFNDCFPPVMDGVAVCVQNYAYWMQKKVGGVSVITPNVPGADYSVHEYEVLPYFSVPVPFRKPYVTGLAEIDPAFLKKIVNRPFKIVHAHCPFTSGLAAAHVAKLRNIPMVATFHSKYRDDFSRVIKSKFEYGFKGPVEVVDNGSDLVADYPEAFFADARKDLGIGPDEFVFLFVGQHIWEKNPRFVIDALEKIKDVPFRMYFVGTGYAADAMKDLVAEKGLDRQVTFVGMLTERADIVKYYAAADLFLFPSLYDNAPLVVREAAALNTPSVMVEGSTAATILKDGENGFLIPNDLDVFAARLRELIHDPERVHRIGVQASRTIVRSWEDVVGEVLDRYNRLIARKKMLPLRLLPLQQASPCGRGSRILRGGW